VVFNHTPDMMNLFKILIICIPFWSFLSNQNLKKYDMVCYKKDVGLCAIDLKESNTKKVNIENSSDFSISPDGLKLVYTKSTKDCGRSIYITDLNTNKEQKLTINNCNAYGPAWSPDNKHIAFNIWIDNVWRIGIFNPNTNEFKVLNSTSSMNLPTWSSDGKFIIISDLKQVRKIDLSGKMVDSFSIDLIPNNYSYSSSTKFFYTSDNKYLIWNGGTGETIISKFNTVNPAEGIMVYDFLHKTKFQLSPKGMHICNPFVDSSNNIYFDGTIINKDSKIDNESTNIYMINLKDRILKLMIENASEPTLRILN
jgi:dipeptidyl aminopeptidase/acylaminoacyl peptidase